MSLTNHPPDTERDPCPAWLIEAVYEVVHRSAVKAPRIAELMGCSPDLLYAFGTDPTNRSGKHWHLPVYRLVALTIASQNTGLLDVIEAQVGRQAHPVQGYRVTELPRAAAQTVEATGILLAVLAKALEDGQISSAEGKAITPALHLLQEQLARLQLAITLRDAQE